MRNLAYYTKAMRPVKFDFPVISVGNLSVGGTGKTPHVEYIIRLLQNENLKVGTLSRGYRRRTKGFVLADKNCDYKQIGDEPMQYHTKFDQVVVAVDEDRIHGVISTLKAHPELNTLVLDDAYQHRALTPGLNILLTEYHRPFFNDFLLPAGRLREWRKSYKRADIIVVTKCPENLEEPEQSKFINDLKLQKHQKVYFSAINYGSINRLASSDTINELRNFEVVLLTGIANPKPLITHLESLGNTIRSIEYRDHHSFKPKDLMHVAQIFDNIASERKVILTTEKDAMRLMSLNNDKLKSLPIYYIEIKVELLNGAEQFKNEIIEYVRENQIDSEPFGEGDG